MVAIGPQPYCRLGMASLFKPGLRQRDDCFLLAAMRQPRYGLTDRDNLSGLGEGRGDHAINVSLKIAIGELVAGELERALRARESALGLIVRRLLEIELGDRRVTALLQGGIALQISSSLRPVRGRRCKLGLRALDLQLQVLRIESRDHVAGAHAVADVDGARDDLAADPEREIGLDSGRAPRRRILGRRPRSRS